MSWHEVCQFLDQSDPNDGLGTHKREKMLLSDLLLEGSSFVSCSWAADPTTINRED